jgi:hypothetical protein
MFKPSDTARKPPRARISASVGRAWLLALLMPIGALAGVSTTDVADVAKPAALPKVAKLRGGYQLRCWQEGRLLFEENHIALPADGSRYAVRMAGSDGKGRPIYVAETINATCLIRSLPDEPVWPR